MYKKILRFLFRRFWVIPTAHFVPSDQQYFLETRISNPAWLLKCAKRYFFFILSGQIFFELHKIPSGAKRILWINTSAPSMGDTLMDVSGRVFLSGKIVHLLTNKKNKELFAADSIFAKVFIDINEIDSSIRKSYDLVILDSYGPLTLLQKIRLTRLGLPFTGFYGFLNGYEIHRLIYSHARLAYLSNIDIGRYPIRPTLEPKSRFQPASDRLRPLTAIAVGGEWEYRTYQHWASVVSILLSTTDIVLLGSTNGLAIGEYIQHKFPLVKSWVGKQTLREAVSSIKECDFFVGSDGGLWHIANALGTPSVVLFANKHLFDQRQCRVDLTTTDINARAIYHPESVSAISPEDIAKAFLTLMRTESPSARDAANV
jgi:hypothetical protein